MKYKVPGLRTSEHSLRSVRRCRGSDAWNSVATAERPLPVHSPAMSDHTYRTRMLVLCCRVHIPRRLVDDPVASLLDKRVNSTCTRARPFPRMHCTPCGSTTPFSSTISYCFCAVFCLILQNDRHVENIAGRRLLTLGVAELARWNRASTLATFRAQDWESMRQARMPLPIAKP